MTTLILNNTTTNTVSVLTLAADPNWAVPKTVTIDNHNYETRRKDSEGNVVTYQLSDSGVSQN